MKKIKHKLILFVLCAILLASFSPLYATPYAFPVPFVAKNHQSISFRDLPSSGTIKIITITGEEVRELKIAPGENIKTWNVKNKSNQTVATGVYFFIIDGDGQKTTGKLIVIR